MQPNQITYIHKVGQEHRKRYGQFFTHPQVAKFMTDWVLESGEKSVFDPAFGLGAFLDAVADTKKIKFTGSDIDPDILNFWSETNNGFDSSKIEIRNEDYLLTWGQIHLNIVCNPPYNRFQRFIDRDNVFNGFMKNLGLKLSGYTNTASAFLLKSISELHYSGRLAYIMPLEFLNTGYGTIVKKHLIKNNHLVSIISLDCEKDVFPEVVTSVGILLYDNSKSHPYVDFYALDSINALPDILNHQPITRISTNQLNPEDKWLSHFQKSTFHVDSKLSVPLDYYGRFTRGIATGANEFFVLKPSKASMLRIDDSELAACITKSAQIKQVIFESQHYDKLIEEDAPVLLFRVKDNLSQHAYNYIKKGEYKGYANRFLTKNRNPWYKTENREPAPLLLGVFSRGGYKIIRNRSRAVNLTCFHGFRPNLFGTDYIEHLFLYLSSIPGREIISMSVRRYGDALDKFEPNDLNNALVPSTEMFDRLSSNQVIDAISHAEATGKTPQWIDSYFAKLKKRIAS